MGRKKDTNQTQTAEDSNPNHIKKNETILIIDDSQAARRNSTVLVSEKGYSVVTAKNGIEGIRKIYQEMPDLIICDVVMPELNGYQLCRLIKNDSAVSHIPIILLTSLGEERDRFWGTKAGADRYIVKKRAHEELLGAVEELIESSRLVGHYSGTLFYVSDTEMDDSTIKSKLGFLLDKLLFEQTLVNEARHLTSLIDQQSLFVEAFYSLVGRLVSFQQAALLFKAPRSSHIYLMADEGITESEKNLLVETSVRESRDPRLFDAHQLHLIGKTSFRDATSEISLEKLKEGCTLVSNIKHENEYYGTLVLRRLDTNEFDEDSTAVVNLFLKYAATSFKLLSLYEENRWLSITDPLTNVYNRRYFMKFFENQFAQYKRYQGSTSLLFIDIDNFKMINDAYGHHVGDIVLEQIARLIENTIRKVDVVARFGGEEFIVLLPQTSAQNAVILAERLRFLVERTPLANQELQNSITVSIGVAEFDAKIEDPITMLNQADQAMFEAKASGKNCVRVFKQKEIKQIKV